MANIKNMQMWDTICRDARISIRKSMLGLRTTAIFQPTNSPLEATTVELSHDDGERLRHILGQPAKELIKAIADFRPKPTVNGNYITEIVCSQDGAFLAIQLLQFIQLNYEPVTDVSVFEGDEAKALQQLFF